MLEHHPEHLLYDQLVPPQNMAAAGQASIEHEEQLFHVPSVIFILILILVSGYNGTLTVIEKK